jgi:hypothetical protein
LRFSAAEIASAGAVSRRISLTRIIALNWYGFRQIIDLDENILISGAFVTGKSALLDLIQYVLLGEHWRANRAASGRSVAARDYSPGFDLGSALLKGKCEGKILKGGGHFMAGGLQFTESQRPVLHEWLNQQCSIKAQHMVERVSIPAFAPELELWELDKLFRALRPFGNGNPGFPLIAINAHLNSARVIRFRSNKEDAKFTDLEEMERDHKSALFLFREDQICDRKKFLKRMWEKQFRWLGRRISAGLDSELSKLPSEKKTEKELKNALCRAQ